MLSREMKHIHTVTMRQVLFAELAADVILEPR